MALRQIPERQPCHSRGRIKKACVRGAYMRFATTFCPALWASNFTALSASSAAAAACARLMLTQGCRWRRMVAKNLSRITVITARASNAP